MVTTPKTCEDLTEVYVLVHASGILYRRTGTQSPSVWSTPAGARNAKAAMNYGRDQWSLKVLTIQPPVSNVLDQSLSTAELA